MIRLLIKLDLRFLISVSVGWWFAIHAARSGNQLYQNDINFFMWSVIAAIVFATAGLTWVFHKVNL